MGDLISDRVEGASRASEPLSQPQRREAGSRSRRRPLPPATETEADSVDMNDPEDPPHKVDSLA
jgi:hypothetical protein